MAESTTTQNSSLLTPVETMRTDLTYGEWKARWLKADDEDSLLGLIAGSWETAGQTPDDIRDLLHLYLSLASESSGRITAVHRKATDILFEEIFPRFTVIEKSRMLRRAFADTIILSYVFELFKKWRTTKFANEERNHAAKDFTDFFVKFAWEMGDPYPDEKAKNAFTAIRPRLIRFILMSGRESFLLGKEVEVTAEDFREISSIALEKNGPESPDRWRSIELACAHGSRAATVAIILHIRNVQLKWEEDMEKAQENLEKAQALAAIMEKGPPRIKFS